MGFSGKGGLLTSGIGTTGLLYATGRGDLQLRLFTEIQNVYRPKCESYNYKTRRRKH